MKYIVIGLLVAAQAHAGVVIDFVNRNAQTGKEEAVQTMSIQNGMARIESKRAPTATMLFKNDTLYVLDIVNKTYRVLDKAAIEQMSAAMNDAMAKMREQMANLPPEQRAAMEQMLKQRGGSMSAMTGAPQKQAVFDAQPTGGSEQVEGKTCKLWNVTRDGVLAQQLCVAPVSAMPGANEVLALSKKLSAQFEKLNQFGGQVGAGLQQSSATLAKINGYPILSRTFRDGVLQPEQFIVKSWRQQSIDTTRFDIPTGYTKQDMPGMK